MSGFVPWNSQPLEDWAARYAPGKFIELDGLTTHYIEKGSGEPVILLHGFFFDKCCVNLLSFSKSFVKNFNELIIPGEFKNFLTDEIPTLHLFIIIKY